MTYMVTGGTGFIGSWVVKAILEAGHDVVCFELMPNQTRLDALLGEDVARVKVIHGDVLHLHKIIEAVGEHFIDVVDEFARYAVLVGGEALPETAHGPVHAIPVESGEACADAQSGFPEIGPGAWENSAIRIGFLKDVLDPDQVLETGGEVDMPVNLRTILQNLFNPGSVRVSRS